MWGGRARKSIEYSSRQLSETSNIQIYQYSAASSLCGFTTLFSYQLVMSPEVFHECGLVHLPNALHVQHLLELGHLRVRHEFDVLWKLYKI